MAARKKEKYGNYICKVDNFDIYMKYSYGKPDSIGRASIESHDHGVYFAKRIVQKGFKTKEAAIDFIKNLPANFKKPNKYGK